jgi:hypothetical protein
MVTGTSRGGLSGSKRCCLDDSHQSLRRGEDRSMRLMLAGALILACSMIGEKAHAQQGYPRSAVGGIEAQPVYAGGVVNQTTVPGSVVSAPVVSSGPITGRPAVSGGVIDQPTSSGWRLPEYSYWAANPGPARTYVPYSAVDQFPFRGRPYGSPTDRWSWYYMGGGNSRYLTRYYYRLLP